MFVDCWQSGGGIWDEADDDAVLHFPALFLMQIIEQVSSARSHRGWRYACEYFCSACVCREEDVSMIDRCGMSDLDVQAYSVDRNQKYLIY